MNLTVDSDSDAATRRWGRLLAGLLRAGDVVVLSGSLGVGKTAFVGGLAEGLGVEETITSPTFILVKRYESGFTPLVHADVYRLGSLAEFGDLDVLDEARDGILVVEWGDAVEAALPGHRLEIRIEMTGPTSRRLSFTPIGDWRDRPLKELIA